MVVKWIKAVVTKVTTVIFKFERSEIYEKDCIYSACIVA